VSKAFIAEIIQEATSCNGVTATAAAGDVMDAIIGTLSPAYPPSRRTV
jgi:hypothetical protein